MSNTITHEAGLYATLDGLKKISIRKALEQWLRTYLLTNRISLAA
jgi:hypothetical protein